MTVPACNPTRGQWSQVDPEMAGQPAQTIQHVLEQWETPAGKQGRQLLAANQGLPLSSCVHPTHLHTQRDTYTWGNWEVLYPCFVPLFYLMSVSSLERSSFLRTISAHNYEHGAEPENSAVYVLSILPGCVQSQLCTHASPTSLAASQLTNNVH